MASRYLAEGATDLNTTASWKSTVDGATGASVPTTADDVLITEGSQVVNTNPTTLNVDLESVNVTRGFTGQLGESGTPLTIACSNSANSVFTLNGGGRAHYITAGTAGIDRLRVSVPAGSTVYLTGGTFVIVEVLSGNVVVASGATVTNLRGYGSGVITARSGTAFTTAILQDSSRLKTERSVTTGLLAGNSHMTTMEAAGSGTIIRITANATLNAQSSGTFAQIDQHGGIATPEGARVPVPVTLFNLYAGVAYESSGLSSFTIGTKGTTGGPSFNQWTTGPGGTKAA